MIQSFKISAFLLVLFIVLISSTFGTEDPQENGLSGNLYQVIISSPEDAAQLRATGAQAILRITDGYLIIANAEHENRLFGSDLKYTLVAKDTNKKDLAIDISFDDHNSTKYPIIYEEDGLRIYSYDWSLQQYQAIPPGLAPILTNNLRIDYKETDKSGMFRDELTIDLDSVIAEVELDSVQSYLEQLQAFNGRMIGSFGNYACRDWAAQKFADFGYDSIIVDTFEIDYGGTVSCMNVVAYKVGTVYPEFKIIVGAHRDGVEGSPAADDNGSGTAGVLEIARVLADYDSKATLIFPLFDAEEEGLHGAWRLANQMAADGDSIVCMLNMDMIGFQDNTSEMTVYHGSDMTFPNLYNNLADSLTGINLTGHNSGTSAQSDHYPFQQNGYDVVFIIEYIFSSVYHTYQDSTTFMSFDYATRAVQSILATAVAADDMFAPTPWLFLTYPEGRPNILPQGSDTSFQVQLTGSYGGTPAPGTEKIYYSVNNGLFNGYDLTSLGGNLYDAALPALECDQRLDYYISVEEASSGVITDPSPDRPILAGVGEDFDNIFLDNFNSDQGWTVSGGATDGHWERGIPVGGGERGDPPTDYDGSGYCFLTDNVAGNSDVDGGNTALTSQTFDLSGGDAIIHYARWYNNSFGGAPHADVFGVYISNNDGGGWTNVETVGPVEEADGGWVVYEFWVNDIITPTATMKIMFDASDQGTGSVVEAGLDDFKVYSFVCESAFLCGDANNDSQVNILDINHLIAYLYLEGDPPVVPESGDVNNDGPINILDISTMIDFLYNDGPDLICP